MYIGYYFIVMAVIIIEDHYRYFPKIWICFVLLCGILYSIFVFGIMTGNTTFLPFIQNQLFQVTLHILLLFFVTYLWYVFGIKFVPKLGTKIQNSENFLNLKFRTDVILNVFILSGELSSTIMASHEIPFRTSSRELINTEIFPDSLYVGNITANL